MIQDQALVASKHFLIETEDKNLGYDDEANNDVVVSWIIWVCVLHCTIIVIAEAKVRPETYSGDVYIILREDP